MPLSFSDLARKEGDSVHFSSMGPFVELRRSCVTLSIGNALGVIFVFSLPLRPLLLRTSTLSAWRRASNACRG